MTNFEETSPSSIYQFPRWSSSLNRPHTGLPHKTANDMFKIGINNRDQIDHSSRKWPIRQSIHSPSGLRIRSPPFLSQPTPTPDICSTADHLSTISSTTSPYHISPIRIKSAALTIPIKTNSEEIQSKSFPKQTHEQRQITQERKRKKQQAQRYTPLDSNAWLHLRQSLAELKRLAVTEEVLVDPTTSLFNCDGYSFEALKQAINEQQEQRKVNRFKSESGISSSMESPPSFNIRSRTSMNTSQSSMARSRMTKRSTETYTRPVFEPLIVAAKPLHPLLLTGNIHPPPKTRMKPPPSAHIRLAPPPTLIPLPTAKRAQLLISDLSNNDDPPESSTPSPHLQNVKEEEEDDQQSVANTPRPTASELSTYQKTLSNMSLKSSIKLKSQLPRCRSAVDAKCSFSSNKNYPRFILITDQEHRIESWYHQYPFIVCDDLLQLIQSKSNESTVSAYFTDDHQQQLNTTKTILRGKPFHLNNDWKKYDLIFISNNIYHQIIVYLKTIIKLSGKLIRIYQVNHHEDLKSQVRYICKQLNQQVLSHI